jgi:predicted Rossmann fold nucleotide-binding protein DprA/Smf involved in DNA uptake
VESREQAVPLRARKALGERAPEALSASGDAALLERPLLGLVCSVRCPGSVILAAYDLALALREADVPVVGGFHSPMERELLRLLLRGQQPVVIAAARSLAGMRVPGEWRGPIAEGRLALVSPFAADGPRRATAATARARNRFVAAVSAAVLALHAAPGGKTEALCREVVAWGRPLLTLEDEHNAALVALGARAVRPEHAARVWADIASRAATSA